MSNEFVARRLFGYAYQYAKEYLAERKRDKASRFARNDEQAPKKKRGLKGKPGRRSRSKRGGKK
jgi:hypothetical protein